MTSEKTAISLLIYLAMFTTPAVLHAQPPTWVNPEVKINTVWQYPAIHPGSTSLLAIQIVIPPPFHINPSAQQIDDPLLIPTQISIKNHPPSLTPHDVHYPAPSELELGTPQKPRIQPGYENTVTAYLPIEVSPDTPPGNYNINLELTYQACTSVICLPAETVGIDTSITVIPTDQDQPPPTNPDLFIAWITNQTSPPSSLHFSFFTSQLDADPTSLAGYMLILLLAATGGLILNLTPCVLPVLPIKAMSLQKAAASRGRCLMLGAGTAAGIIIFWLGLGSAISLISGLTLAGQLFQYPAFSITTGLVVGLMAIGMCGLFAIRLPQWVYRFTPAQHTLVGSIGVGVMTAILSTPCTGPFMGTAATWGVTQTPATTLAVFAAIGMGMASPYLLLSAFPSFIARIPHTGPASETIKQVMGLFMLAAAAYFIGVGVTTVLASPGQPPSTIYWWAPASFCVIASAWAGIRTFKFTRQPLLRATISILALSFAAASVIAARQLTDTGPIDWVYYTPQRFAQAQRDRQTIVLDFTAEWCINCRVLEETVLSSPTITELLNHTDVTPIKVDLTANSPEARAMLNNAGSIAIPLLVVYNPDGQPIFKSEAYSITQLASVLRGAIDQPILNNDQHTR